MSGDQLDQEQPEPCQYCGESPCTMGCAEENDDRGVMHEGYNPNDRGPL